MTSIKTVLADNHANRKKSELVEMLSGLAHIIGPEAYAAVSGVDPDTELTSLTKAELIQVADEFRDAYHPGWERNLRSASLDVISGVLGLAAQDAALFSVQDNSVSDADFAAELGSIDFATLIGGPMNAAVTAQNNASMATVNFIKEVGFDRDANGEPTGLKMADFSYSKQVPDTSPGAAAGAMVTERTDIKVPFISILNVPSLRIETLDIDFNVKLNSTYTKDVSSELGVNASASGGWGPVRMKVSAAYKRSSATGVKVEKEYSMAVKVRATNDELPAGLEKVLGLMSA